VINPGTYRAKPVGGAFDKNKKGNLACGIKFDLTDEAVKGQQIWWVGYLTPAAIERTLDVTTLLGLSDAPKTDDSGRFDASQFADQSKEFELVIEHEEYEGKTRARVKWVNEIGGGMKFGNLDPKSLAFELNSINFRAEVEAAKKRVGMKPAPKTQLKNHAPVQEPSFDSNEEIPF
jgi:hypothetical protein